MKKESVVEQRRDDLTTVLSISTSESDLSDLEQMIDPDWTIRHARTLPSGISALRKTRYTLIICDADSLPGAWKDLLRLTFHLSDPPNVIVTSRLADDYLWAEALNLGAYDVLAKPFDKQEVGRVLGMAHRHWRQRRRTVRAASV